MSLSLRPFGMSAPRRLARWLVACLLAVGAASVSADELRGIVVGVVDGNTLTIQDAERQLHRISLAGIDAPEAYQAFGQKSRSHLSARVFNRAALARCGRAILPRTRLCRLMVNGTDINLEQVKAGMAWWDRQQANEQSAQDRQDYELAESWAKMRRLGLWSERNPVPPWEWRRQ